MHGFKILAIASKGLFSQLLLVNPSPRQAMLVVVWGSFVVCCGALRGVAVTRRASGRFGVAETRLCAASSSTEVLRCYRASELTLASVRRV